MRSPRARVSWAGRCRTAVQILGVVALFAPLALASGTAGSAVAADSPRLETAVSDPNAFSAPNASAAFADAHAAGATAVRLILNWDTVAPAVRPPSFQADDPSAAGYSWEHFDEQVRLAVSRGLQPLVDVYNAPKWARERPSRGGAYKPDLVKLARFSKAAARRYSGAYQDLPRVRYWQLWNEPNLALNLRPQIVGKKIYSAMWYRRMLKAFANAVHSVHPSNSVIAGGTSPFTSRAGQRSSWGPGPLLFLREVLCLSKQLRPACSDRAHFDIWAHHPYTSGGPNHHANIADDVSLADLPRMRAVLNAGVRAGHVVSKQKLRFWVTEFSWDTSPPDPAAMPIALQARWVSEALYVMSRAGVSLVTWWLVKDEPLSTPYQSGLYFRSGKRKPTFQAFRFPFVAFARAGVIEVWGRAPPETARVVIIEQRHGRLWRRLGSLRANGNGIFQARYRSRGSGDLRARLPDSANEASRPFSLREPPDRFFRPFGQAP